MLLKVYKVTTTNCALQSREGEETRLRKKYFDRQFIWEWSMSSVPLRNERVAVTDDNGNKIICRTRSVAKHRLESLTFSPFPLLASRSLMARHYYYYYYCAHDSKYFCPFEYASLEIRRVDRAEMDGFETNRIALRANWKNLLDRLHFLRVLYWKIFQSELPSIHRSNSINEIVFRNESTNQLFRNGF